MALFKPSTKGAAAIAMLGTLAILPGCITVNAPEEPIVIEEVIYRLAEDAGNTIDQNADIF